MRHLLVAPPPDAPARIPLFGEGEAEAIALAQHLGIGLLINEHRAATYAVRHGISVVTVPDVIVGLRIRDIISNRAARRKLDLFAPNTAKEVIQEARRVLATL
ncbi:MAG: hypothetical protein ACREH3_18870 [Geminicoccales bacterium]